MGLFSSKRVTRVGTTVSRMIDDDNVPQSVRTALTKSLFADGNIPDYIMEELVGSIGVRAERLYRYAEKSYTHGLPSGEIFRAEEGKEAVEAVLEAVEGEDITIDYSYYAPPNTLHIGWLKLTNEYGYNANTNEIAGLSAVVGSPVYLKDMSVVVPLEAIGTFELGALDQWGTSAKAGYTPQRPVNSSGLATLVPQSQIKTSMTATDLEVLVEYVWVSGTPEAPTIQTDTLTLSVSEFDDEIEYFQTKYRVGDLTKYWIYRKGDGVYPALDNLFLENVAVAGSYFPFTYFRFNKQAPSTSSDSYKTSKKMLKILGMDYDVLKNEINANPDIGDVEQAMMIFAVPPVSTKDVENRYLFDYFDRQHAALTPPQVAAQRASQATYSNIGKLLGEASSPGRSTVIRDNRFKMALSNSGITKRLVNGSIGKVGTYTSGYQKIGVTETYEDLESGQPVSYTTYYTEHKYRRQTNPNIYEEIVVRNLKMTYFVFGNYTTTGDDTDDILLIPIDKLVSEQYSIPDRENLYSTSLHFVFNSRTVTKVKWYQRAAFRNFLFVVAVVLTVLYPPAGLAAWGLTGAALIAAAILYVAIVGFVLQKAFSYIVDKAGIEFATVLAIALLVYGGYTMIQSGSYGAVPWAGDMLMLSNGLQSAIMSAKIEDILDQQRDFNLFIEEQTKILDEAKALLENNSWLSPFVVFGESPEEFYNRTVHYGNIGTLGITVISSYVDIALTLPKLNDTLGEPLNATL